jgi:hypothetical protein
MGAVGGALMKLKKILSELAKVVSDEAERNPEFADRLQAVFVNQGPVRSALRPSSRMSDKVAPKRPLNRRPEPVLDPLALGKEGEAELRKALADLDLERLRDIVAGYAMDPSKLVMKWKDPQKVADRIVEVSLSRIKKGSAFLEHGSSGE